MKTVSLSKPRRDECAELWWSLYQDEPYVLCPDGYQNVNSLTHITPGYFLKRLDTGLACDNTRRWHGEVLEETVMLAEEAGTVVGFIVCSINLDASKGSILAAYVSQDQTGRRAARALIENALEYFASRGLQEVVAGPDASRSLEVKRPLHTTLLDSGFAWQESWELPADERGRIYVKADPGGFEVVLGGSLEGFRVSDEIERKVESLHEQGIAIERYSPDRFGEIRSYHTEQPVEGEIQGVATFVATLEGLAVGWLWEILTFSDVLEEGTPRVVGGCVPYVLPGHRGRGIGKVLYQLGMAEAVKQGAQCGWTVTGIGNPARLIYQSIGYENWYLSYNQMYWRSGSRIG